MKRRQSPLEESDSCHSWKRPCCPSRLRSSYCADLPHTVDALESGSLREVGLCLSPSSLSPRLRRNDSCSSSSSQNSSSPKQSQNLLVEGVQSARRGLAFVYLHYVYEPFFYRQRKKAAHEFLAGRAKAEELAPVEDAVVLADLSPFSAQLPADVHDFVKPEEHFPSVEPEAVFQALPRLRLALREALESRRVSFHPGVIDACVTAVAPDPERRHFFYKVPLQVQRGAVFDSVCDALLAATPDQLLAGVHVQFEGVDHAIEAGIDSGGLSCEFFRLVLHDLVDGHEGNSQEADDSGLIRRRSSVRGIGEPMFEGKEDCTLVLLPSSRPSAVYFVLGRLIAVALVHASYGDVALPFSLNDCLLKNLVGQPITATDVRNLDPQRFQNQMETLLKSGGIEEAAACLCVEHLVFEENGVELIPGGASVVVTPENVELYIARLSEELVCGRTRTELSQFLAGFHDIVPQKLLRLCGIGFADLGTLLSGVPIIDVATWRCHAEVHAAGVTEAVANTVAGWFWSTLEAWPQEDRSAALAFATGLSRMPAVGFDPSFTLMVFPCDTSEPLPTAHTCFNRIDMPAYSSAEVLASKLELAMREGVGRFDLL